MSKKAIPKKIHEYLGNQIVPGSAGYEAVETVLNSVSEPVLREFLEWYENLVRDGLLTSAGKTSQRGFEDLLKGTRSVEDERDLQELARCIEDEEPTTSLMDFVSKESLDES